MKRLSVRLRLALVFGLVGFAVAGLMLVIAYRTVDSAVVEQPIVVPAVDTIGRALSEAETADLKDQRVAAEKAIREELRTRTLTPLLDRGLVAVGVTTAVCLLIGWSVAGASLRPLRRITAATERIADHNLHERLPAADADEWSELSRAINSMLTRLDATFAAQRDFVGNASHELKTPLAINQTLLEVAMNRPGAPIELIHLGENLLAVNNRHERLVDGLLVLARAQHGIADPRPVDLGEVVVGVLNFLRPEAEQGRVRVAAETAGALVKGDRVLLDRMVQNLVQNAIRHNVPDGWMTLHAGTADGHARLTIVNSGPILHPSTVPDLFEPFRRANSRVRSSRGTGLGLSIVRSVVYAHGGTVIATAREEGGLRVEVVIPLSDL